MIGRTTFRSGIPRWLFAALLPLAVCPGEPARAERLPARSYATGEGLPADQAGALGLDAMGHILIGTAAGLSRFDGQSFFTFGPDEGLAGEVYAILATREGDLWAGTHDGLARLGSGAPLPFELVPAPGGKPIPVFVVRQLRDGSLWAGSSLGLHRVETSAPGPRLGDLISGIETQVDDLSEDPAGNLWVATHGGLLQVDPTSGRILRHFPKVLDAAHIPSVLADSRGLVWAATHDGLCLIAPGAGAEGSRACSRIYNMADGLPSYWINALHEAPGGRLYVGTGGGLASGVPAADGAVRFAPMAKGQGVPGAAVYAIQSDSDGNIWIGTHEAGVVKIPPQGFNSFDQSDGLRGAGVYSIYESRRGDLYVGGVDSSDLSGAGERRPIQRFNAGRFLAVDPFMPHFGRTLGWAYGQAFLLDAADRWWVPSVEGARIYPPGLRFEDLAITRPSRILTRADGLRGNEVFRLFEDSHGDVWIGTIGGPADGLSRWERATGRVTDLTSAGVFPAAAPTAMAEDGAGSVWVTLYIGGVLRVAGMQVEDLSGAEGLPRGYAGSLLFDRKGRLWVGTGSGLARADDPRARPLRFRLYTERDGLASRRVQGLAEDARGRIWISTAAGVAQLDPETDRIRRYTTSDGLPRNDAGELRCDRHGAVWVGTKAGVARMEPVEDRPVALPPILLDSLEVAGEPHPLAPFGTPNVRDLRLQPGRERLRIAFHSIGFRPGESVAYQYRLDGEGQWSPPAAARSVLFDRLAPGRHHFEVRAVTLDGLASPAPATIDFYVEPPFWRTWWFAALLALAAAAAIFAWHRLRLAQAVAMERVRTHIATDLHDDIGSSLSQIAIFNEVGLARVRAGSDGAVPLLESAAQSARELVDTMSDVVWAVDPRRDRLGDLVLRMRRFAEEGCAARGIELRFTAPQNGDRALEAGLRRQLYLVFKEGFNNAVRHSECRSISIALDATVRRIALELADDGRGFDTAARAEGHGLASMQRRSKLVGGALTIRSTRHQGTTLHFEAPC